MSFEKHINTFNKKKKKTPANKCGYATSVGSTKEKNTGEHTAYRKVKYNARKNNKDNTQGRWGDTDCKQNDTGCRMTSQFRNGR